MAKGHKGEIEHIMLRPAKGGVVSSTSMKYKRGGQGGGPSHDYEEETRVHPTHEHLASHLKDVLGHVYEHAAEEEKEVKSGGKEED